MAPIQTLRRRKAERRILPAEQEAIQRLRVVVTYARVSSQEQAEQETYKPQIALLEGLVAARRGPDIPENERVQLQELIVDDGVSGADALPDRKNGQRLIALTCPKANYRCRGDCKGMAQYDELWVTKLDRLARRLDLLIETHKFLAAHGVRLIVQDPLMDTGSNMGKLLFHMLGAIAEWEREEIHDRTTKGRTSKAKDGKWLSRVPFGLKLGEDGHIVVDETLVQIATNLVAIPAYQIMAEVFQNVSQGVPVYAEAQRLGWPRNTLSNRLHNDLYTGHGFMQIDGKIVEVTGESVVDLAMFGKVDAQMAKNTKSSRRHGDNDRVYMLGNRMMICAKCGSSMVGYTVKKRFGYYTCATLGRVRDQVLSYCGSKGLNMDLADRAVWAAVSSFIRDPGEALHRARERARTYKADLPRLEQQLRQVTQRLRELDDESERVLVSFEKGRRSEADTDSRTSEIEREAAILRSDRIRLEVDLRIGQASEIRVLRATTTLLAYQDSLDALDDDWSRNAVLRKRAILDRLVTSMTADGRERKMADRTIKITLDAGDLVDVELSLSVANGHHLDPRTEFLVTVEARLRPPRTGVPVLV